LHPRAHKCRSSASFRSLRVVRLEHPQQGHNEADSADAKNKQNNRAYQARWRTGNVKSVLTHVAEALDKLLPLFHLADRREVAVFALPADRLGTPATR
jgi:hypothetical protein